MTKEQILEEIPKLKDYTSEQLVHYLKCATSRQKASEKRLLAPFINAIQKERKSRGIKTISAKPVQPKLTKNGAKADDY